MAKRKKKSGRMLDNLDIVLVLLVLFGGLGLLGFSILVIFTINSLAL